MLSKQDEFINHIIEACDYCNLAMDKLDQSNKGDVAESFSQKLKDLSVNLATLLIVDKENIKGQLQIVKNGVNSSPLNLTISPKIVEICGLTNESCTSYKKALILSDEANHFSTTIINVLNDSYKEKL